MEGGDLGDGLIEPVVVLLLGDSRGHPPDRFGSAVSPSVGGDPQRFAVSRVEIDLDRPVQFRNGKIEPGLAMTG